MTAEKSYTYAAQGGVASAALSLTRKPKEGNPCLRMI